MCLSQSRSPRFLRLKQQVPQQSEPPFGMPEYFPASADRTVRARRGCKDNSLAGGCRVVWPVVLGEFVGTHLFLAYGDPETGTERDVEVAVAQGGRQVGRLRAGEQ